MTASLSDPIFLSRLQFAGTTIFHILWPLTTIGLALFLVVLEALWLKTGDLGYYRHCRFWSKLFALSFATGVVTGIPLEFQFGTNWAPFSIAAGNTVGHLLAFEGALAFMLEAAFLSVMLLGWNRVGPKAHFFATLMVFTGATLSAFWIMAANGWMQAPTGGHFEDGRFIMEDFWGAVANPDTLVAFTHMWTACLETGVFLVGGISAYQVLRGGNVGFYLRSLKISLALAVVIAPLQAITGDSAGIRIARYQPSKVAAIEAHWETNPKGTGASWNMVAWPDPENERNTFAIQVPTVLSLLVTHDPTGTVKGLKEFPRENRPPIALPFFSFRIMVGIGFAMIGLMLATLYAWRKGWLAVERVSGHRLLLASWVAMAPLGYLATEVGWITREVGRQPWIINNWMRTEQGASILPPAAVGGSLAMYLAVYGVLLVLVGWFFARIMAAGPDLGLAPPVGGTAGQGGDS